ncbi:MAG: TonB-dependent receptor [Bacteroidetes bacterium]|nr:TonB-dependent receptor [Bacteroidota bacterium]
MKKAIEKIPKILPVFFLLVLISFVSKAQNSLTGTVTDSKGAPVQGVNVTIKGTKTTTQTAADGTFKITSPTPTATLVLSSVGYGTQEISVTSGTAATVALTEKNQQLNEVVVVGYGTAKKKDLTGAVTVVTSKDFQKGAITTPEQLIAGKVAGVSVISNGGAPGAGSTIRIRGGASLNASNDPLIVIDGVPLSNDNIAGAPNALSLINPNDIESFNILKDASAAAIYGSRASNGVIIITTKRGTAGKMKINFNTQMSIASIPKTVDVMNADEFTRYVRKEGTADQLNLLAASNTDWQKEIYQTAISYDNNLSLSGTWHKVPYRISLGHLDQKGILRTSELHRASAGINISPRFLKNNLKVDLNLKGSQTESVYANEGAIGTAVIFDPTKPIRVNSNRYNGYFQWLKATNTPTGLAGLSPKNPVSMLEEQNNEGTSKRSIGNVVFDYKLPFFPSLRANLNLGYDVADGYGSNFINDSSALSYRSFFDSGTAIYHGGVSSQYHEKRLNKLMEFYLGYNKDLKSINGKLDLIAGYSYNDFRTTVYYFDDKTSDGTITKRRQYNYDEPQFTLISYYARLNFSLSDKYLLTATVRRDGSSRFSKENHWGTFPSVALAWRIKEEGFLKNSKTFSDMKLRLGYGVTGQQDGIGLYDYKSFYTFGDNAALYQLGNTFYTVARPGGYYPNRKWEQTATSNIGLDFGLFDGRLTGTAEFYLKKTTDLLNQVDQSAGSNFTNKIVANVGSMENRGVELTLSLDVIKKKDLTWNVTVNGAYNKNKITKLTISDDPNFIGVPTVDIGLGTGSKAAINTVNFPRNSYYVYKQVYDDKGNAIEGLFEDLNRDGVINAKDLYRYKHADPDAFFGLSSSVTYKRWNAGIAMRAQLGNYVYNQVEAGNGTRSAVLDHSDFINNGLKSLLSTNFTGTKAAYLSDYYIQNASFLRMDNLNIGYNFGRICHSKSNLRANFSIQNVFVITNYKGLDPEISSGIDNNFYPRPRTYVIGLNLDL